MSTLSPILEIKRLSKVSPHPGIVMHIFQVVHNPTQEADLVRASEADFISLRGRHVIQGTAVGIAWRSAKQKRKKCPKFRKIFTKLQ
jgi:hypothetical protein